MLPNNVKLVIWDLDDTFWSGTLAEGDIVPNPTNHEIIKTLCQRGIMSSICSKNNFEQAKATLEKLDIWNYFIFPKIEFSPKGKLIGSIIEEANLRVENVLFIDDHRLNREEVTHFCPGIMTADPIDILDNLLEAPQLAGKEDTDLTRLYQYKNLQKKIIDRAQSQLENEKFLRECGIRVEIDHDLEGQFDRIVELANRSNQLNFTKIRLETPEAIDEFHELCASYGSSIGTIRVSDRYGDYGIVGYYVLRKVGATEELVHFVFSCRAMNIGIEQYVHERLGEPSCKIVPPVANPIKAFKKVDWIKECSTSGASLGPLEGDKKLVLIGGCELRQLASLCSSNRAEYVNEVVNSHWVRHDDLGFILSDRNTLKNDEAFSKTFNWTASSAESFDLDVELSAIVIASLFRAVTADYFKSAKGSWFGLGDSQIKRHLNILSKKFIKNFWYIPMGLEEKLELLKESFDHIVQLAPSDAHFFALGVSTWVENNGNLSTNNSKITGDGNIKTRIMFNNFVKAYCDTSDRFTFIDLDAVVGQGDMITSTHFHRRGYLSIAKYISKYLPPKADDSQPST